MGYQITITEFRALRAGISACGDSLYMGDWLYTWRVNAGDTEVMAAKAGISYCGDPLRSWGSRYLKCKFNQLSPHTIVQIGYSE